MSARRIGVLGGMFDPVHLGHLQLARVALEELALDVLRMVPCHLPNHRAPAAASAQARLTMLSLATQNVPRIVVDDRECRRQQTSYTVDTLLALHAEFPAATLVLVLGDDAFAGLERWHRWQQILELAHLLVVSRPGAAQALSPTLSDLVRRCQVDTVAQLFERPCGALLRSRKMQMDISSTAVREALQARRATSALLPACVQDYIDVHGLYTPIGAADPVSRNHEE
jgi:nicotinate-nucleotide adenylyltransferase